MSAEKEIMAAFMQGAAEIERLRNQLATAKEAGALSMLTYMAHMQGRTIQTLPSWIMENMSAWRNWDTLKNND